VRELFLRRLTATLPPLLDQWSRGLQVRTPASAGEWFEDKRHGYGVMEWPDGRRYAGEWVADTMADPSLTEPPRESDDEELR